MLRSKFFLVFVAYFLHPTDYKDEVFYTQILEFKENRK